MELELLYSLTYVLTYDTYTSCTQKWKRNISPLFVKLLEIMIKTWALKIFNDNIKFMLQDLVISVSFIYTQMAMYKKLRFCWLIQSLQALVALLNAAALLYAYSTCGQMADNGVPFANRGRCTELQHYCVCGSGNRNLGNYEIFGWKYFLYMIASCRVAYKLSEMMNLIQLIWNESFANALN